MHSLNTYLVKDWYERLEKVGYTCCIHNIMSLCRKDSIDLEKIFEEPWAVPK